MLLTCPAQTPEFLKENNLGVEVHITRDDQKPEWEQYVPFVGGIHLPYDKLNLAALDDDWKNTSIETLKTAIDTGLRYGVDKMVMHPRGMECERGEAAGSYARLIDSLGQLADYAAGKGVTLCLENAALHQPRRRCYGIFAKEWFQIFEDLAHPNILLTLDTSHAATSAAMLLDNAKDRFAYMYEFLKYPERIGRVHWSDSRLTYAEAYFNDLHLVPGDGDLPRAFHREILQLPVVKTLEQKCPEEDLRRSLAFIATL